MGSYKEQWHQGAEHADNNAVHKITHEIQSGQRIKTGQERSENEGKNRKFKQLEVKEQVCGKETKHPKEREDSVRGEVERGVLTLQISDFR